MLQRVNREIGSGQVERWRTTHFPRVHKAQESSLHLAFGVSKGVLRKVPIKCCTHSGRGLTRACRWVECGLDWMGVP